MRAFIEISKEVRRQYSVSMPFFYAMVKELPRNSVKNNIDKYIQFKASKKN